MPPTAPQGPDRTPLRHANDGWTIARVAREVGVHPQTVYRWIRVGKLGVTRFGPSGGIVRVHPDDARRLIDV